MKTLTKNWISFVLYVSCVRSSLIFCKRDFHTMKWYGRQYQIDYNLFFGNKSSIDVLFISFLGVVVPFLLQGKFIWDSICNFLIIVIYLFQSFVHLLTERKRTKLAEKKNEKGGRTVNKFKVRFFSRPRRNVATQAVVGTSETEPRETNNTKKIFKINVLVRDASSKSFPMRQNHF